MSQQNDYSNEEIGRATLEEQSAFLQGQVELLLNRLVAANIEIKRRDARIEQMLRESDEMKKHPLDSLDDWETTPAPEPIL